MGVAWPVTKPVAATRATPPWQTSVPAQPQAAAASSSSVRPRPPSPGAASVRPRTPSPGAARPAGGGHYGRVALHAKPLDVRGSVGHASAAAYAHPKPEGAMAYATRRGMSEQERHEAAMEAMLRRPPPWECSCKMSFHATGGIIVQRGMRCVFCGRQRSEEGMSQERRELFRAALEYAERPKPPAARQPGAAGQPAEEGQLAGPGEPPGTRPAHRVPLEERTGALQEIMSAAEADPIVPMQEEARLLRVLRDELKAIRAGSSDMSVWEAIANSSHRRWRLIGENIAKLVGEDAGPAEPDRPLTASQPADLVPGSWKCTFCGNPIAPEHEKCTTEGCEGTQAKSWGGHAAAPGEPVRRVRRKKSEMTTEEKHALRQAASARRASRADEAAAGAGGWQCPRCRDRGQTTQNYMVREWCFRCQLPRPAWANKEVRRAAAAGDPYVAPTPKRTKKRGSGKARARAAAAAEEAGRASGAAAPVVKQEEEEEDYIIEAIEEGEEETPVESSPAAASSQDVPMTTAEEEPGSTPEEDVVMVEPAAASPPAERSPEGEEIVSEAEKLLGKR